MSKGTVVGNLMVALSAAIGSAAAFVLWNLTMEENAGSKQKEPPSTSKAIDDDEQKHLFRYIDEFLSLKCAEDLIAHKIYPNAKEITESFSVLHALRTYLNSSSKDPSHRDYHFENSNVTAVVIGDGSTPRIASLLCFITKWNSVYSVDPMLNIKKNRSWNKIRHLKCKRSKIEDLTIKIERDHNVVVLLMHSHVLLDRSLESLCFTDGEDRKSKSKIAVVTVPCCQFVEKHKTLYDKQADFTFTDVSMATDKNTFYIWKDVKRHDSK